MAANAAKIAKRRVRAWSCLDRFQAVIASDFFIVLSGVGLEFDGRVVAIKPVSISKLP